MSISHIEKRIGQKSVYDYDGRIALLPEVEMNYILARVLKNVCDEMDVPYTGIWINMENNALMPRVICGVRGRLYSLSDSGVFITVLNTAVQRKKRVIIRDLSPVKEWAFRNAIDEEGIKSLVAYPMIADDIVVGVLVIALRRDSGRLTKYRVRIGGLIAKYAARSVLNARLARETVKAKYGATERGRLLLSFLLKNAKVDGRFIDRDAGIINILTDLIDRKDGYVTGHSCEVMNLCAAICRKLKLEEKAVAVIMQAAVLHDIGKIVIPGNILKKCGRLSDEEWQAIRKHPSVGELILKKAGMDRHVCDIVKHHHARYGGGGYPDARISGGSIPMGARIIAASDAYDAMISDRPYRKALKKKDAIKELKACAGTQFDPKVITAFLPIVKV
ncbi:MAG: HD domain-containing phosphohydrolase [Candidatus Omnitrophota bacterium]